MEENISHTSLISDAIGHQYSTKEAKQLPPLSLAYIGDGVFETYVRKYLISRGESRVDVLAKSAINFVQAKAQAKIILNLQDVLTPDELTMVKRGRNTKSSVPKNAKVSDYRYATGFETLVGYLYLTAQSDRLNELMIISIEIINKSFT
jgi:ribonuclease-3 family protein